ncbi:hypothetical protein NPIL_175931 [Nephila pilipes]|uniref:Uncharacterized protein n=1 Tax=Nephila pilipes TaxID=299642 RepID=A0A8X6UKT5_NEPPI|nr:hypothetical protein NPIL_175931 [Nephila pilipes]
MNPPQSPKDKDLTSSSNQNIVVLNYVKIIVSVLASEWSVSGVGLDFSTFAISVGTYEQVSESCNCCGDSGYCLDHVKPIASCCEQKEKEKSPRSVRIRKQMYQRRMNDHPTNMSDRGRYLQNRREDNEDKWLVKVRV